MRSQAAFSTVILLLVCLRLSAEPILEREGPTKPKSRETLVEIYFDAGSRALIEGYREEGEKLLRSADQLAEQESLETMMVSRIQESLAKLFEEQGKWEEAQHAWERSAAIIEKIMGSDSLPALKCREALADHYQRRGMYTQMENTIRGAVEIAVKETAHPLAISLLQQLAECFRLEKKYKESEETYAILLHRIEKRDGIESQLMALALNKLAELYREEGKNRDAEKKLEEALAVIRKVYGPEHPSAMILLCSLADVKRVLGKIDEALKLYTLGLEIASGPKGTPAMKSMVLLDVGKFYQDQQDDVHSTEFYKEGLKTLEEASGGESRGFALKLLKVGELHVEAGKSAAAEEYLVRALKIVDGGGVEEDEDTARVLRALGKCYLQLGRLNDAEPLLKRALAISEKSAGDKGLTVGYSLELLGDLSTAQGKTAEAEALFVKSIAIEEQFSRECPDRLAEDLDSYSRLLQKMDRKDDAGKHAQRARELRAGANMPPTKQE